MNSYACECMTGWHGPRCEHPVNHCLDEPCRNNGTCQPMSVLHVLLGIGLFIILFIFSVDHFECICAPGFNGTRCDLEQELDDVCERGAPCDPEGTDYCESLPSGVASSAFQCHCRRGFAHGRLCAQRIDPVSIYFWLYRWFPVQYIGILIICYVRINSVSSIHYYIIENTKHASLSVCHIMELPK